MKPVFLLLLAALLGNGLYAQEKIETDRPNETETPVLVPKKFWQAELGFDKKNAGDNNYQLQHPTALFRYGLSRRIELRMHIDVATEHRQLIPNPKNETGLEPVELGAKIALLEEKGARPQTALIAKLGLPFLSSPDFRVPHLAPAARLAMQHTITKAIDLGYNLGMEWDGNDPTPTWLYTFAPDFELADKWNVFVEVFGFIAAQQKPQHSIDAGFAYLISNNVSVDAAAGLGLSEEAPKNFVSMGISFRLPRH